MQWSVSDILDRWISHSLRQTLNPVDAVSLGEDANGESCWYRSTDEGAHTHENAYDKWSVHAGSGFKWGKDVNRKLKHGWLATSDNIDVQPDGENRSDRYANLQNKVRSTGWQGQRGHLRRGTACFYIVRLQLVSSWQPPLIPVGEIGLEYQPNCGNRKASRPVQNYRSSC